MAARTHGKDRPDHTDDTALAAAFLDGDPAAVERIVRWIAPVVRHRAWGFETPEDVTQATLLALVVALRGERFDGTDLRAFARRIARNICVSCYRRHLVRRGTVALGTVPVEPSVTDPTAPVLREMTLAAVLGRLDPACRDLIRMAYAEELSAGEIGRRLGAGAGAVRVRLHRCLERAREMVRRETDRLARWRPGDGERRGKP